ncbi:MAG: YdeI/OmpD-associated family protein [Taibaiella sp.]|nr:YdeI/OmpD-associated family protein [Taibaiella sp.]
MELLKKLRIDASKPVWVVNAPANVGDILPDLDLKKRLGKEKLVSQLLLFALDSNDLARYVPLLAAYIGHETLFWICWPKQTGAIQSDLVKMAPWQMVFDAGYRGQTSVSINDDWTGLRLTNAPRKKPSKAELPMEQRSTPGIDYVKRTVSLPADVLKVMKLHNGLVTFFDSMSFSHKREYIEAIEDAKKPETRARRIEKMAEMVLKLKQEKELKAAAKKK